MIRTDKPKKPKKYPLPYLRHKNDMLESSDEEDSTEIVEVSYPKREFHLRLINGSPSPVRNVLVNYHKRHLSPDIHRIKF